MISSRIRIRDIIFRSDPDPLYFYLYPDSYFFPQCRPRTPDARCHASAAGRPRHQFLRHHHRQAVHPQVFIIHIHPYTKCLLTMGLISVRRPFLSVFRIRIREDPGYFQAMDPGKNPGTEGGREKSLNLA